MNEYQTKSPYTAIQNYTARVAMDRSDIDLRFLVHYVSRLNFSYEIRPYPDAKQIGDVHQPLHLTSRERGGNGDQIVFEGRHMSMHGKSSLAY